MSRSARMLVKRLFKPFAAGLMLLALLLETVAPARGQAVGVFRAPQGRRVGRVRLPTPPFNPDAGILDSRTRPARATHKAAARRRVKAAQVSPRHATPRKRRVRRVRRPNLAKPRV